MLIKNRPLRILLILLLITILIISLIQFFFSIFFTKVVNDQLPVFLKPEASINKIKVNLFEGSVTIRDLMIKQPQGFPANDLLLLSKLKINIQYLPLLKKKISISKIYLNDLKLNIDKKMNKELNILNIMQPPSVKDAVRNEKKPVPEIFIKRIDLNKIFVNYTEIDSIGKETEIAVSNLNFNLRNANISETEKKVESIILSLLETTIKSTQASKNMNIDLNNFEINLQNIVQENENFQLKKIETNNFNVLFSSRENQKDSLQFYLTDLYLLASGIEMSNDSPSIKNNLASIEFTGKIQHKKLQDNLFGLYARIRTIRKKIPPINAIFQVIGLELEPFEFLLPLGTYQAIGGDAFDLKTDITLSEKTLHCDLNISTIQGSKLGMKIGGTPQKPEFETTSILFNVVSRLGGGIGSSILKVGGTTIDAAKTSLNVALGLGKGATNVAGSLGKGVFKTVKGVVTADLQEIGDGLKESTVGTVSEAGKTVLETGENLIDGTGETLNSATGKKKADKWRLEKEERWEELWEKRKKEVDEKTPKN
ncbi:MAG TPA: hypothetical protein ENL20_07225 [Candidatus Cloacimonetes bacterium]|nr:hypothetical protein [Candidatus Cloacimonadota bacterium]